MSAIIDLEFYIVSRQSDTYVQARMALFMSESIKKIYYVCALVDLQFPKFIRKGCRSVPTSDILESITARYPEIEL